jgi:hypothetical protein
MARWLRVSLIGTLALGITLVLTPAPASAQRVGFRGGFGGFYGRGWGGPGWGWGGWGGWGPGWYDPGWGYYYYAPNTGKVKIVTNSRDAQVYVDGGYAGPIAKTKKFTLHSGQHELSLREPDGRTFYNQRIEILRGRTTEIHADFNG